MRFAGTIMPVFAVTGFVAASALPASSQTSLNEKQLLGMRLFNQSCRVCHTKPQLTSQQYGPVLSRETLGGQEDALRSFIGDGTSRMPGFKYSYNAAQIDSIVAYLKTVPAP
jgi:mono/diheme cytochrome c family protein